MRSAEAFRRTPGRRRAWALPALLVLAAAGCGHGDGVGRTVRTDSGGVALVSNPGPDRPLSVELTREFAVGGDPAGPGSFYRVYRQNLAVGPEGTIAVLDQDARRVVLFGPDGAHRATLAREGDGPGELRHPSSLTFTPDGGVAVFDWGRRALLRFGSGGTFLDQERLEVPYNGGGMVGTPAGLLALSRSSPRGDGERVTRLVRISPGDTVQVGPAVTSPVSGVAYESCGVRLTLEPLFAPELVWASNGRRTALAPGPRYSVSVYDGGELVMAVRREIAPEPVTEAVARRVLGEGEEWGVAGRECTVPVSEVLEERGHAELLPVVLDLATSPSGRLWVKRRSPAARGEAVDLFTADGGYLGTAPPDTPFPVRFLPDGRFVTVERDSLDVDRVVVYRVEVEE